MRTAEVVSVGASPVGHSELTNRDLFTYAVADAFDSMNEAPGRLLDALIVGNQAMTFENQIAYGPLLGELCGMRGTVHTERVEACAASGGLAVRKAVEAVRHGVHDVVLAAGVENMTGDGADTVTEAVMAGSDRVFDQRAGITAPAMYALLARRYLEETDNDESDLARFAVKNHENARTNPIAQFDKKITIEDVLESEYVAPPIKLYDSSPVSDGAAVVLIADSETAETFTPADERVQVSGSSVHSDTLGIAKHDLLSLPGAQEAIETSYDDAGIGPADVDIAEVHDAFTINEALSAEAAGFVGPGNGPEMALAPSERSEEATSVRMSTSGGLKARGHPIGATGVLQVVEVYRQLTGTTPQTHAVEDASVALTVSEGGTADSMTLAHVFTEAVE
jgi:acetyl-CoA acetyltransferase